MDSGTLLYVSSVAAVSVSTYSAEGWAGCVVTALLRFVGNFVVMTCSVRQSFFRCLCHRTLPTLSPASTSCFLFPRPLTPATQTVS